MNKVKLVVLLIVAGLFVAFFASGLHHELTLEAFRAHQADFAASYDKNPALIAGIFFGIYVAVAALSLPGAAILTLAAGALFGLGTGLVLVSFASSIGATLAFLVSRFLLRDMVQAKFGNRLEAINQGVAREGGFYLFALRLVPVFPFFVINLVMGLTSLRTVTFYWVSQVGMLAGTAVYVNAGTQLAQLDGLGGILSPALLSSFLLLGVFPFIAKKILSTIQAKRVYKGYKKPKKFDRNMVVIGAGSAGLVTSYIAAAVKAKVTLIERHKMGGDCLNTGCVPSKALIRTAKFLHTIDKSKSLGVNTASAQFNFADVMERVQRVIKQVEPHDSVERFTGLGVECKQGSAKILSPWEVEINLNDGTQETLTTKNIVIATGARPFVPDIPGLEEVGYLTSDTIWDIREQPKRLLVLGAGPIGCELAQAFCRLGTEVIQVQSSGRVMLREDEDVSEFVAARFKKEGIDLRLNSRAVRFAIEGDHKVVFLKTPEGEQRVEFDQLLLAVGRQANLTGFGLEELGIETQRTIVTNEFLQAKFPNVYACGDVAGPYQFTHTAAHQAWFAAVNGLFGRFKKFKVDYRVIPWTTFTDPEVARVGLNELEAKEKGIAYEVTHYGIDDLDRAIADESAEGWVKVLTVPGKDQILGCTIVGQYAGDLLAEYVLAMKHGLGMNKILGTIHTYPTWAEANKFTAGEWKKANSPKKLLEWVAKYHNWERQ